MFNNIFYYAHGGFKRSTNFYNGITERQYHDGLVLSKYGKVSGKLTGDMPMQYLKRNDLLTGWIGPWGDTYLSENVFPILPLAGMSGACSYLAHYLFRERNLRTLLFANKIIALCGSYQFEMAKQDKILKYIAPSMIRFDCGIDRELFSHIKKGYNEKGKRGFLFMGRFNRDKGFDLLIEAIRKTGYNVVCGELKSAPALEPLPDNLKVLGPINNADVETWECIAKECDFIITPSRYDCQPLSNLENISRGFIPICTDAAGVDMKDRIRIEPTVDSIIEGMEFAQTIEDEDLHAMSKSCHKHLDEFHSWDLYMEKFDNVLKTHGVFDA